MLNKPEAIRDGFGEGLAKATERDKRVLALSADLTDSCRMDIIKKAYPAHFIEIGVAEQNMIGVAAGLARTGFIPFTGSFAAFSPGRTFDQIRVSVCYSQANVKIYGGHAGLTVGEDGATHQMCEDIALMRSLPNMTVFVPCDKWQAYQGTLALAQLQGPAYIRGSRAKVPSLTNQHTPFTLGKIDTLRRGNDITIIACGIMVEQAVRAAYELQKRNIHATVLNIHTIKPLDVTTLITALKTTRCAVVAEEHQKAGGLYGAVCETAAEFCPVPLFSVAVNDTFGESAPAQQLLEKYGLTVNNILKVCDLALTHKKA